MFDSIQGGTTMKKVALLLSALLFLGCAAFGQALTQADRERSVKYLQQTRDGVVGATKGLSEAQMKFKPAPDRWSVAETLEHIALAEDFLLQNISEKIMKAPPGSTDRDTAKIDAMVLADRKSTRLNSSHVRISYAVFCLKKKKKYRTYNDCG